MYVCISRVCVRLSQWLLAYVGVCMLLLCTCISVYLRMCKRTQVCAIYYRQALKIYPLSCLLSAGHYLMCCCASVYCVAVVVVVVVVVVVLLDCEAFDCVVYDALSWLYVYMVMYRCTAKL